MTVCAHLDYNIPLPSPCPDQISFDFPLSFTDLFVLGILLVSFQLTLSVNVSFLYIL